MLLNKNKLLIFMQSCTGTTILFVFIMVISDGIPVQFWLINCDTYNEKETCGIYNRCFCQPFQCDDSIVTQFTDDSLEDFFLQILDENGELAYVPFDMQTDDSGTGVYSYSFTPQDLDICNKQIQLKIFQDSSPEVEVAKSDCLDIQTEHACSVLMNYYSSRNYAGIKYASQSPDVSFNLRVPGVFYHERYPEENKSLELVSSSINTSGKIKTQRRLDVFPSPDYFHKKLQIALRHQFVTIDNLLWSRDEAYDKIEPTNKRWPLKKGSVWLTQRNSIIRNTL